MVRPMWKHDGRNSELWSDLYSLPNRMTRLLGEMERPAREYPPVNVWANDDEYVLAAEVPGVEPKDLDISVHGEVVTLQGILHKREPKEGENPHWTERRHGRFSRRWKLPFTIDKDNVQATLQDGILRLVLPKVPHDKPRKIQIETK